MSPEVYRAKPLRGRIVNAAGSIETAARISQDMPGLRVDPLDTLEAIASRLSTQAQHDWSGLGDHPDLQP